MDMDMSSDFDRLLFLEHTRRTCETIYIKNPLDTANLVKWGGTLLDLAQFHNGPESKRMVQDCIEKLEEALSIDPGKTDALWCLGNAYTSIGFVNPDIDVAKVNFDRAAQYFEQAYEQEPQNDMYKKSLGIALKAPDLHAEIHKHGFAQQAESAPAASANSRGTQNAKKKSKNSDFVYDIGGWVILAVGIVAWLGYAKSNMPPPPSSI